MAVYLFFALLEANRGWIHGFFVSCLANISRYAGRTGDGRHFDVLSMLQEVTACSAIALTIVWWIIQSLSAGLILEDLRPPAQFDFFAAFLVKRGGTNDFN